VRTGYRKILAVCFSMTLARIGVIEIGLYGL